MNIKSLYDYITALRCSEHGSVYLFVRQGDLKLNESRMMCDKCVSPQNQSKLIHIEKAFELLNQQEPIEVAKIKRTKSTLWQQFKKSQARIYEVLQWLESLVVEFINSIIGNKLIDTLRTEFLNKDIAQVNMESLGYLLSSQIDIDNIGKYQLKQEIPTNDQFGAIQLNEILKVQQQALDVLIYSMNARNTANQVQLSPKYETIQTLQLNSGCSHVSFNHNETQVAVAGENWIQVCNVSQQGQQIIKQQLLNGHSGWVQQVKFNHNSTQLASCGQDKLIIIWSKQDGNWVIQDTLRNHNGLVETICFNHDSTILASGGWDKLIQLYTRINNKWQKQQLTLNDHKNDVNDLCFNHDSTLLASGSRDKSIILWQQNNVGKWIFKQKLSDHTDAVHRISFNSDSTQLVSCSQDGTIKIFSCNQIFKCIHTLTGHTKGVKSVQINKYSNMIVSSSWDQSIKIWRINQDKQWKCTQTINQLQYSVNCIIISWDSSFIISGSWDKTIQLHRRQQ